MSIVALVIAPHIRVDDGSHGGVEQFDDQKNIVEKGSSANLSVEKKNTTIY